MKKITLIIAALSAIGLSGCKKYLDQAVNPNAPSVTTLQLSLTGAEKALADIPNGNGSASYGTGLYLQYGFWIGYWAVSSGFIVQPDLSQYVITPSEFQSWTDLYLNLSNISALQGIATAQGAADYSAIAQIMRAYDFEALVDQYNDVPYSQALNPNIIFPAYDKGPAIYADLIKQLDAAIATINSNAGATPPQGDDIIFQGNMTNWKKFANTLKLRLIIRQSNLSNFSTIAADMSTTLKEGFLDGTTEATANPGYTLNDAYGGQESPFWLSYGTSATGAPEDILVKANTYFINKLHGYNDPRLFQLFTTVTDPVTMQTGIVHGLYLGDPTASQDTNSAAGLSNVGPGLLISASMPAVIFSGAESLFLQAEAANDGIIPGSAQTLYQAAITASFEEMQVPNADAAAATYYSQNIANVGWAASSANLESAIITQKYIAICGYGNFEAYNEYRRTGYPSDIPRSLDPAAIGTGIPTRIYYPQVEYNTNGANVGAEGTINEFGSKIFWAK